MIGIPSYPTPESKFCVGSILFRTKSVCLPVCNSVCHGSYNFHLNHFKFSQLLQQYLISRCLFDFFQIFSLLTYKIKISMISFTIIYTTGPPSNNQFETCFIISYWVDNGLDSVFHTCQPVWISQILYFFWLKKWEYGFHA